MAEYIYDNPKTMCREIMETFSNGVAKPQLMLSVPKAAVDLKLSIYGKPWGNYPSMFNMSLKKKDGVAKQGVKRSDEEVAVLKALFKEWEENRKQEVPLSRVQFWNKNQSRTPRTSLTSFLAFCTKERELNKDNTSD